MLQITYLHEESIIYNVSFNLYQIYICNRGRKLAVKPYFMIKITCPSFSFKKGKTLPGTGREGPCGCETSRLFWRVGSQMAVRLSAIHTGRPVTPGRFLVLLSVKDWVDPRVIV
jgi:hypothetical protein